VTHAPLLGGADPARRLAFLDHVLPAGTGDVWQALTDPDRTARWLGRLVGPPLGPGRRVTLWHDDDVASQHVVVRWEPDRLLELTWDFPDERPSRVRFVVGPVGDGGARLTVQHEDLDDPASYAAGWHRHVEYLDAHLRARDLPPERFWDGYDELLQRYRRAAGDPGPGGGGSGSGAGNAPGPVRA